MSVADDVGTNLGRPLTEAEVQQVQLWERWIEADITLRASQLGVSLASIDLEARQRFAVAAISHRMRNPRGATRVSVGVDDGRVSLDLPDAAMEYLPHWWSWLGLVPPDDQMVGWAGSVPYRR